jgi:hypothetical protein
MLAAALSAGGQSAGAPRPVPAPPWADTQASNSPAPSRRGSFCVAVTAIIVAPQQAGPAIAIAGRHRLTSGSKQRCYSVFCCHRYPYGSQVANCILSAVCTAALQAAGPGYGSPGSCFSGGPRRDRPRRRRSVMPTASSRAPARHPAARAGARPRPVPTGAERGDRLPGRGRRRVPGGAPLRRAAGDQVTAGAGAGSGAARLRMASIAWSKTRK